MNKYKIIGLIILFFLFARLICNSSENKSKTNSSVNACDTINKIDLLLSEILAKDSIYTLIRGDTIKTKHLLSNDFIKPGKVFRGPDTLIIISVNKDSTRTKNISLLYMHDTNFNEDTTTVFMKVSYIPLGIKPTLETSFNYYFDNVNCKWIMKDKKRTMY